MGLLDELLSNALRDAAGSPGAGAQPPAGGAGPLAEALLRYLNDPANGGIGGLADRFQRQGLGDVIASWIGTGQNHPIAPDALERVLGDDRVSSFGQGSGLSGAALAAAVAAILPELIHQLTPQGEVPPQGSLLDLGAKILAGLAGGATAPR